MSLEDPASADERAVAADPDLLSGAALPEQGPTLRSGRQRFRLPLLIAAPVIAIVAALLVYLHGGRYEVTDNAYFQSGLVSIAPNISGQVLAVDVRENERVRAGQILFQIDPAPYQAAVDGAEAALANARAQVGSLRANYAQGVAELQTAKDQLSYAAREAARQKELLSEGISSQAQYDQARLAEQSARNGIQTNTQKNASVQAALSGNLDTPLDNQPGVRSAQAALDRARLNLSYTVVRAPQAGIVTKVNQLQVGNNVVAARAVFSLAGTRIWVEANFKENQLDHMRVGQPASFQIDAFPDLALTGRLVSFSPGTGNSFSLLPPENATGNWVKVVQRLPVQFEIDALPKDTPLHAGLSVEVTVDTGYRRHLLGNATPSSMKGAR